MAKKVFHPKEVWPLKEANAFLMKNLTLVKEQREELESDLKQDNSLKPHEKHTSFKAVSDFKAKMNKQQKTQRASLVPLLTIPDKPLQAKLAVHNILEECGAEVIDSNDPRAVYSGWENKIFPPVFKPLKSDPSVDVSYDDTIGSHYLDISQEHKETIKKSHETSVDNHDRAAATYHNIAKQFCRLFKHLSGLANYTNDFLCIYSKLFLSQTDHSDG